MIEAPPSEAFVHVTVYALSLAPAIFQNMYCVSAVVPEPRLIREPSAVHPVAVTEASVFATVIAITSTSPDAVPVGTGIVWLPPPVAKPVLLLTVCDDELPKTTAGSIVYGSGRCRSSRRSASIHPPACRRTSQRRIAVVTSRPAP